MKTREIVAASFECCESTGVFTETFYEIFLAKSDAIGAHFKNTDFTRQKKLLRASILILILQDTSTLKAQNILQKIADTHAKEKLNISPDLYDFWLDALCETVACRDPLLMRRLRRIGES